jgi:hypothetical protein
MKIEFKMWISSSANPKMPLFFELPLSLTNPQELWKSLWKNGLCVSLKSPANTEKCLSLLNAEIQ